MVRRMNPEYGKKSGRIRMHTCLRGHPLEAEPRIMRYQAELGNEE